MQNALLTADKSLSESSQKNNEAQHDFTNATQAKNDATSEHIDQVKANIAKQNNTINHDKDTINEQQKQITAKQGNVDSATNSVKSAKNNLNKANDDVNYAQENKKTAQDNLNGTNAETIKNNVFKTTSQVKTDQDNIYNVNKNLSDVQLSLQNANKLTPNKEEAVKNGQQNFNTKQSIANDTQKKLDVEKNSINDIQNKVNDLNNQLNQTNHIVFPKGYSTVGTNPDAISHTSKEQTQINKKGLELSYNFYKNSLNPKDNKVVNPRNLNDQDRKELTLWTAQLLNTARNAIGSSSKLFVTDKSLALGKYLSQRYFEKASKPITDIQHDFGALKDGNTEIGLDHYSYTNESISGGADNPDLDYTLNDLKKSIYYAISSCLFDDNEEAWGHANMLAGLPDNGFVVPYDMEQQNQAFSFFIDKEGWLHFITYYATNNTNGKQIIYDNSTRYDVPDVYDMLVSQLSDAKADLATKQSALAQAKSANQIAQQDLSNAEATLAKANADLTAHKATVAKLASTFNQTQNDLKAMQTKLANDQQLAHDAQVAYDNLSADLKTKEAVLANAQNVLSQKVADQATAKQDLANKEASLKAAQNDLQNAKDTLTKLQAQLASDQAGLTALNNKLDSYEHADDNLAKAQAALVVAKAQLQTATTNQAEAQANYDLAKKNLDAAQATYDKFAKEHADGVKAMEVAHAKVVAEQKAKEQQAAKRAEIARQTQMAEASSNSSMAETSVAGKHFASVSGNETEPMVNGTEASAMNANVTMSNNIASSSVEVPAKHMANNAESNEANQAKLPQTNESNGSVMSLIGLALSILTFGIFGYERRH